MFVCMCVLCGCMVKKTAKQRVKDSVIDMSMLVTKKKEKRKVKIQNWTVD